MKVLIIGGTGQLGQTFAGLLPDFVSAPSFRESGAGKILEFAADSDADAVINCAAWTDVLGAEKPEHQRDVYDLNTFFPAALAETCSQTGKRLVTFSTDYVFNGQNESPYTETDKTHPLNVYGLSKRAGERLTVSALTIRTAGLYSTYGKNFIKAILKKLSVGTPFSVTETLITNLTDAGSLAAASIKALDAGLSGVHHFVNSPPLTWYAAALAVERAAGRHSLIDNTATSDTVCRPIYSALDSSKLAREGISGSPEDWGSRIVETVRLLSLSP